MLLFRQLGAVERVFSVHDSVVVQAVGGRGAVGLSAPALAGPGPGPGSGSAANSSPAR